mmetsp:Transcript_22681/g.65357  ORF Transcript_22681/g.65357 Transcript_22681/m.65357 type:complete len:578 (+) Transcript_22681:30-1763(+)
MPEHQDPEVLIEEDQRSISEAEEHVKEGAGKECAGDGEIEGEDSVESNDSIQQQVTAQLSLTDQRCMRGMPMYLILHKFGQIWGDNGGSAATFRMSRPAKTLQGFVSHNWSTPRLAKFRALMLHFNLALAFATSVLAAAVGAMLTAHGAVPYMESGTRPHLPRSLASLILGGLGFWLALLFGHDLGHFLGSVTGSGEPHVFLDKSCIHQTDEKLKRQGIDSLGAFLVNSQRMIILFSDTYFRKIWTVYELACFLCTKTVDKCVFLSVYHPPVIICGWWLIFGYFAVQPLWRMIPGVNPVMVTFLVGLLVAYIALLVAGRGWHDIAQLQARLRHFSMEECHCHDERDRPIVYQSVAAFMKYRHVVRRCCTVKESLHAFEAQVQTQMADIIDSIVGRTMLRYRQALTIAWPQLLAGVDTVGAKCARGDTVLATVMAATYNTAEALLTWPAGIGLGLLLMRLPTQLGYQSARARAAFAVPSAVLVFFMLFALDLADYHLSTAIAEAKTGDIWLPILAYVTFLGAEASVVWLEFGTLPVQCGRRGRRQSRSSITFDRAHTSDLSEDDRKSDDSGESNVLAI